MVTPAEHLKTTAQTLRSKIADERDLYMRRKAQFEVYYPNEWKEISEGIVLIANYFNGEIVRAKHDLADWMNGHEVKGTYGTLDAVGEFHDTLDDVLEVLEKYGKAKSKYDSAKTPESAAELRYELDDAAGEKDGAMDFIRALVKGIEENCYAER